MYIGRNGSANVYHIKGILDDIRIYNRASSNEEIKQLYDITTDSNYEKDIHINEFALQ